MAAMDSMDSMPIGSRSGAIMLAQHPTRMALTFLLFEPDETVASRTF